MNVVFAGGDLRFGYAARPTVAAGHTVSFWECPKEAVELVREKRLLQKEDIQGDVLVLPYPLSRDGQTLSGTNSGLPLTAVVKALPAFRWVVGGGVPKSFLAKGPQLLDLSDQEN